MRCAVTPPIEPKYPRREISVVRRQSVTVDAGAAPSALHVLPFHAAMLVAATPPASEKVPPHDEKPPQDVNARRSRMPREPAADRAQPFPADWKTEPGTGAVPMAKSLSPARSPGRLYDPSTCTKSSTPLPSENHRVPSTALRTARPRRLRVSALRRRRRNLGTSLHRTPATSIPVPSACHADPSHLAHNWQVRRRLGELPARVECRPFHGPADVTQEFVPVLKRSTPCPSSGDVDRLDLRPGELSAHDESVRTRRA